MTPESTPPDIYRRTLELLEELTAISSSSGDLAGLRQAAERLGAALAARGLTVEIRDEIGDRDQPQPVLFARQEAGIAAAGRESRLLVIGHLDTVLPARLPERHDGRLYATGAIDMKGGLAAFVGALELLAAEQRAAARDLELVVVPDEEVTGILSRRMVEELGVAARALWVLEPGQPVGEGETGAETAVLGRRGMFHWRLTAHGRGAHAGNAFWNGRSALEAAADWCLEARRLASPGAGPTINAARLLAGDADWVDDPAGYAELVGTTRRLNVVPDRALAEGEARYLDPADAERLPAALGQLTNELALERGVEIEFTASEPIPPVDPRGLGRAWLERAVRFAAEDGWRLELEEDRGGISFPNFLTAPGKIPVLDGLGPVGGGMHTRDEYVELRSLDRRIRLLAELLALDREEQGASN